jgi:hypothetical protein
MSHAEALCRRGSQVVAITRHERVGEGLYELALAGEWGAIQPGQFLHVRCGAGACVSSTLRSARSSTEARLLAQDKF